MKMALAVVGICGLLIAGNGLAVPLSVPDRDDIQWYDDKAPSAAMLELGKTLFFDPRLVKNEKQSCSSCHAPAIGWADGVAKDLKGHSKWGRAQAQLAHDHQSIECPSCPLGCADSVGTMLYPKGYQAGDLLSAVGKSSIQVHAQT